MCYLVAKRFNKSGCIALQIEAGEEMAKFADALQEKLGYDIQIITISRPTAYGEYEPYHFVCSYDEFSRQASLL
ncbi:hypothetical protein H5999_11380 [[Clostridium] spiroforme]|nr:hypothetical protein [Thomasclavelia spiroformis]